LGYAGGSWGLGCMDFEYSEMTERRFTIISYRAGIESMISERLGVNYFLVFINRHQEDLRHLTVKDPVTVEILDWQTKYKNAKTFLYNKDLFVDTVVVEYLFR
jgi:hypothetical protein